MSNFKYGSAEFYAECFSDFICDIQADEPKYAENLLKGFCLAIEDWLKYHKDQADAYAALRERVRQTLAV